MSISPHLDHIPSSAAPTISPHDSRSPLPNTLSPSVSGQTSNTQLVNLLSTALRESENLQRELAIQRQRTEKAERLLQAFQTISDSALPASAQTIPESVRRILNDYEDRAIQAEKARDEAENRRLIILENWQQCDHYMATMEVRAADARASFLRVLQDGAGTLALSSLPLPTPINLSPNSMPPPSAHSSRPSAHHASGRSSSHQRPTSHASNFPALSLPPHPNAHTGIGTRRPRAGSVDGSSYSSVPGQPPAKRSRGERDDYRGREDRSFPESTQFVDARDHRDYSNDQRHQRHHQTPRHPQQQGRNVVQSGEKYSRRSRSGSPGSHSRSSSRSSEGSISLDEMLLRATTGDDRNGVNGNNPMPDGATSIPQIDISRPHRHRPKERDDQMHLQSQRGHSTPEMHPSHHQNPYQPSARGNVDSPSFPYRSRSGHPSGSATLVTDGTPVGPLSQPGQAQTYQIHTFAPVVTGAPIKKTKFPGGASASNLGASSSANQIVDTPLPAPPAASFPATNQQGQRICRQCGMAGRYKDGKCVEKWGPGPMGPGTVCDRCRKKMKRVERRGTLESQQMQQTQPSLQPQANADSGIQRNLTSLSRTDTMPTQMTQSGGGSGGDNFISFRNSNIQHSRDRDRDREESAVRPSALPTHHSSSAGTGTTPSEKGVRAAASVPNAGGGNGSSGGGLHPDDAHHHRERGGGGGGSNAGSRVPSRASSRNGKTRPTPTPPRVADVAISKRSPLGSGSSSGGEVVGKRKIITQRSSRTPEEMEMDGESGVDPDADADADAEAEAEIEGAIDGDGSPEGDAEADAEADLLEAVDAAEANSNGSSASGGWLKSEEITI